MSESYSLATEPEGVVPSLIERFNSGKVSAMMGLYDSEAVLIADDGRTVTDLAEIVVDWSIDGTGPDGEHVHVEGSASDIARRGADGLWRNLIDNRRGTAV